MKCDNVTKCHTEIEKELEKEKEIEKELDVEEEIKVKGCFIAIGQIPNNENFSNLVDLDKNGYIIVNEDLETKTKGLFVAGDCRVKKVRQLTTAVSDGAMASVGAVSYIDKNF